MERQSWNLCACQHYTLNPIILADYWLDSVCSLCRWSRLTLSLPCLVRLYIYIINYITLLIIIFTRAGTLTSFETRYTQRRNNDTFFHVFVSIFWRVKKKGKWNCALFFYIIRWMNDTHRYIYRNSNRT